jgi:hypothetical protein
MSFRWAGNTNNGVKKDAALEKAIEILQKK